MTVIHRATQQLKEHEGLRLKPYKCTAGKTTIGYGRNLDDVGITPQEAGLLLDRDISVAYVNLQQMFSEFKSFSTSRQVALIDMIFNLGETRFRKFKNMIAAINDNDWEKVADEATDSTGYKQVGDRAKKVVSQLREAERWY